jgi:hypothetical protein
MAAARRDRLTELRARSPYRHDERSALRPPETGRRLDRAARAPATVSRSRRPSRPLGRAPLHRPVGRARDAMRRRVDPDPSLHERGGAPACNRSPFPDLRHTVGSRMAATASRCGGCSTGCATPVRQDDADLRAPPARRARGGNRRRRFPRPPSVGQAHKGGVVAEYSGRPRADASTRSGREMVQATLGITPGRPPVHAQHGLSIALRRPSANAEHRLRMTAIAWRVLLSRSRSTRLVDRLVELGWAARCMSTTPAAVSSPS